jgi:hypothetical protein
MIEEYLEKKCRKKTEKWRKVFKKNKGKRRGLELTFVKGQICPTLCASHVLNTYESSQQSTELVNIINVFMCSNWSVKYLVVTLKYKMQ